MGHPRGLCERNWKCLTYSSVCKIIKIEIRLIEGGGGLKRGKASPGIVPRLMEQAFKDLSFVGSVCWVSGTKYIVSQQGCSKTKQRRESAEYKEWNVLTFSQTGRVNQHIKGARQQKKKKYLKQAVSLIRELGVIKYLQGCHPFVLHSLSPDRLHP